MYEKLVSRLRDAGLDAAEGQTVAGFYYDGEDQGECFPVVRIETDFSVPFSLIDRFVKRRGLVYDWRSCWGTHSRLYTVWSAEDRKKARFLDEKARVFMEAFWMYRHINGANADQSGMIAAGKKAVSDWMQTRKEDC